MKDHIGYVAIEFDDCSKQEVVRWASQINERDIVKVTIEGKEKGGNVTHKLHLTLFYGFNEDAVDQPELDIFLAEKEILPVEITGIGMFPIKEFDCNVLYLEVADDSGELRAIHERLATFPHFLKYQKSGFKPHITIAYVMKGFESEFLSKNFPRQLSVEKITHFQKNI